MLKKTLNLIIGVLLGTVIGVIAFSLKNKTPNEEIINTPTVKEFVQNNTPPSLNKLEVKRIELDPNQVIMFNTQVDYQSVSLTISRLDELTAQGYNHVYIVLDSPGGSVIDGANLIAYMKASKIRIDTVCQGICASMAAQIHQAGKKRYMTDKSILMFHPAALRMGGKVEEMLNQIITIKKYVDRLDAEVAARAGIKYEVFKQMIVSELWVESVDAVEMGFADKIVYLFNKPNTKPLTFSFNLKKATNSNKINNVNGLRDLR
jgi:ATP-dependent Clp protease protease subunit